MLLSTLLLGGVTITLAPQARVRGTEIELGSIAKVEGEDAEEVERVRKLRLGYAPAPGTDHPRRFRRVLAADAAAGLWTAGR